MKVTRAIELTSDEKCEDLQALIPNLQWLSKSRKNLEVKIMFCRQLRLIKASDTTFRLQ